MNCECEHSQVCRYKDSIIMSFGNILEKQFGGINPGYKDLSNLIKKYCKFRTAKVPNYDDQHKNWEKKI